MSTLLLLAFVPMLPLGAGDSPGLRPKSLDEAVKLPAKDVDLGHAALLLSKEFDPKVDIESLRGRLDAMAREAAPSLAEAQKAGGKGGAILGALSGRLFETWGFALPERDDPESFLLHSVLERKRGNCLGLSVLFLALGERLSLPVYGVALPSRDAGPGHVVVRWHSGDDSAFADLTRRGNGLTFEEYRAGYGLTDEEVARGYYLSDLDKRLVLHLLLVNLAGGLCEARRYTAALSLLERAARIKEDHAGLWNNFGSARFGTGDLQQAEEAFRKASGIDPRFLAPRLGLASVLFSRGDAEGAGKEFRAVLDADAKCAAAHHGLGAIALRRGAFEAAVGPLEKACDLRPDDAAYARDLGIALTKAGFLDRAKAALERARKLRPRDPKVLVAQARLAQAGGDVPAAEALANAALEIDPKCADAMFYLAEAQFAFGKDPDGDKYLERTLSIDPNHSGALFALGRREYNRKRLGPAVIYLKRAAKAAPDSAETWLLLGQACLDNGDHAGAIDAYSRVLQVNPSDQNTRYKLCAVYLKAGKQESAMALAQWCIGKDPKDSAAWQLLGCACENLDQKEKAIEAWKKANELTPNSPVVLNALKRLGIKP